MTVISTILDSLYEMVSGWSLHADAYDPGALCHIDRAEETMRQFGIPLPPRETVQLLISEQMHYSFGNPFDGLRFSGLSERA